MAFLSIEKKNLPIYGLPKVKTLEDFTTTEKDLSRGISRMPLALARLTEEDILKDSQLPSMKKDMSMEVDQMNSLDDMVNLKRQSVAKAIQGQSSIVKTQNELVWLEEDEDDETMFNRQLESSSENIFTRDTLKNCRFEDFKIRAIVGKGNFGKVYLVESQINGKFHAMKSIRKDIVIESDSIENLKTEKSILLQVNHPFIIGMDYVF